ncbi:conserved Plasmodium protein, unknown function [Plasmodium sp. gorilla clade G2]|uniref:conserved Plasmodium protein, unknown function n=1 Tax=Plasmodium sp. gorilla clade G2 TaxID=880535 RepID=UPI000D223FB0|nr:conserved Plasmodium protein, unknown function [Plasmodium sp. gorilla clade G2]SOV18018.1 conserved Plasmodium protein, unknown function [Plasmodium sp. gorilla clade G2]
MFNVSSLIYFGNNNSIKKSIAGDIFIYTSKKKKNNKFFEASLTHDINDNKEINNNHYNNNLDDNICEYNCNVYNKWEKYYCFIKANFFYIYKLRGDYKPHVIFLLEGNEIKSVNYYIAIKNKIIQEIDDFPVGENEDLIQIKIPQENKEDTYILYIRDISTYKKWMNILKRSNYLYIYNNINTVNEENEDIKKQLEDTKRLNDIEIKNKDIHIKELKCQINSLKDAVENIRTKNKRLQIAAEVNVKSADEYLQKKMNEMEFMQNEIGIKMEENKNLREKIQKTTEECYKKNKVVNELEIEKNTLEKKMKDIMLTLEDACSDPEKLTLINYNTNERYQKIVLNNKNLKQEIIKMNERFYELEDRYKEKIKTIKEIVEIGDIFDYLHKLILLCQTKIKYYEQAYKYNEEEEKDIINSIQYMIKETKVSEAHARICYITHRSKILEERLTYYTTHKIPSDYFYFACTTLKRLGWIFGEIEILSPLNDNQNNTYSIYSYVDNMNIIPMREQIYYNEGLEGRNNYKIVSDIDIYTIPRKMCPYQEMQLCENKYNYIKIKLNDLKKDFNIFKKKTRPQNASIISDLQWAEMKKNAYERLERNIILLQKKVDNEDDM